VSDPDTMKKFFSLMLSQPQTRIALADVIDCVKNAPGRVAQLAEWLRGDATQPNMTEEELFKFGALMSALQKEMDSKEFIRLAMRTLKALVM
jgi:hypothetical protein